MYDICQSYARGDDETVVQPLYNDLTAAGFGACLERISMPSIICML